MHVVLLEFDIQKARDSNPWNPANFHCLLLALQSLVNTAQGRFVLGRWAGKSREDYRILTWEMLCLRSNRVCAVLRRVSRRLGAAGPQAVRGLRFDSAAACWRHDPLVPDIADRAPGVSAS